MGETPDDKRLTLLEREIRILKKKLERSEANRTLLEEAVASHIKLLKARNDEIERSREQIRRSEAMYRNLALNDSLTGLPNRLCFHDRLGHAIARAEKAKALVAVLFADLDRFKAVNDLGGHYIGDAVLLEVGKRLVSCVRSEDTVSRVGGDEFVIILEDLHDKAAAVRTAERILAVMREPFWINGQALVVGASIGICFYPFDGTDIDTLVSKADAAMYQVKQRGRDGWMLVGEELYEHA